MSAYDFANILFAGPCNRACPWCIGKQVPAEANMDNLELFPPPGLGALIEMVNADAIREVVLTGTISDPQLYRHEARLVALLRARLHAGARLSLHTNGVLALRKMDVLDRYDRACISLPSFVPATYQRMMGSPRVPDLARIVATAKIPLKVSCVVDDPNEGELDSYLAKCAQIGVARVVLRKLFGEKRTRPPPLTLAARTPTHTFKGNPVYDVDGMEVTLWDFDGSQCRSLNLFPDGTLGTSYHLTRTTELERPSGLGRRSSDSRV
jgi:MoaA/NifB/PqqE/SkfB family radical SAM enzyme